ncbi:hypothetical protein lerEdw1_016785 [Lerista edwardsae]|nr:hypothetical protein lerEdw1_016785 [Lerista edwardsae]
MRIYKIECVVNTDTAEAELEFETPAYQAVVQDIPITNMSQQDWKLKAHLKGFCFYGPPLIYVAAGETTFYTLTFKPISECVTKGKLRLQNAADGTDHVFILKGIATKPLALDHIVIDCQVRQITQKVIMVPNFTKNTLRYKVFSDLPIVNGETTLRVEPDDTAAYTLNISPWKRGKFKGIISFVPEDGEQQQSQRNLLERTDGIQSSQKLSTEAQQTVTASNTGRFIVEIQLLLSADGSVVIGIPVTNPTNDILPLDVQLIDPTLLSGERNIVLEPKALYHYEVKYSPAVTGDSDGSVIFLSEKIGEFWFALKLHVKKPQPTTVPEVECELGKWIRQYIPLKNPTYEILELKTINSNAAHFSVEIDCNPLIVPPHSTTEVPVLFCPSGLGRINHTATITFTCSQLEEWVFYFSGIGLIPQPLEPASVSSRLGHHSSIILSFKNPALEDVLVDVILTDQEHVMHHPSASDFHHSSKDSIFWLPLKQKQASVPLQTPGFSRLLLFRVPWLSHVSLVLWTYRSVEYELWNHIENSIVLHKRISLPPKGKLDIPVLFAPQIMVLYEAVLVIKVERTSESWPYDDSIELTEDDW